MVHNCKYVSTKTYNELAPVAYRQWKAESHCNVIHGYCLSFHFEFASNELDVRNWVIDFGGLRPLRDELERQFDHCLLVADDDPQRDELIKLGKLGLAKITEVPKTGCEGIADLLYEYINTTFLYNYGEQNRVWCTRVEVRETDSNMSYRQGYRDLDIDKELSYFEKLINETWWDLYFEDAVGAMNQGEVKLSNGEIRGRDGIKKFDGTYKIINNNIEATFTIMNDDGVDESIDASGKERRYSKSIFQGSISLDGKKICGFLEDPDSPNLKNTTVLIRK